MSNEPERLLVAVVTMEKGKALIIVRGSGGILQAESIVPSLDMLASQGIDRITVDVSELTDPGAVAVEAVLANYIRHGSSQISIELRGLRRAATRTFGERELDEFLRPFPPVRATMKKTRWRNIPVNADTEIPLPVYVRAGRR